MEPKNLSFKFRNFATLSQVSHYHVLELFISNIYTG